MSVQSLAFSVEVTTWLAAQARVRPLREAVFVVEQGVPIAEEWDEWDAPSLHAIASDTSGDVLGTGRLLPNGRIGRLAVRADKRKHGIGRAMMHRLMAAAWLAGHDVIIIHAQTHAEAFYCKLGFARYGLPFSEAGIDHVEMHTGRPD